MLLCGIDPGLSGAIAIYDTSTEELVTHEMPVHVLARGGKTKREIDRHTLADILRADRLGHAFIESVSSMPGQGVASMFAFGRAFGIVLGIVAAVGIPETLVASHTWKKRLGVPAAKHGARARASQLFPAAADQWRLVKHDGRAEAALIALWGYRSLQQIATGKAA